MDLQVTLLQLGSLILPLFLMATKRTVGVLTAVKPILRSCMPNQAGLVITKVNRDRYNIVDALKIRI